MGEGTILRRKEKLALHWKNEFLLISVLAKRCVKNFHSARFGLKETYFEGEEKKMSQVLSLLFVLFSGASPLN